MKRIISLVCALLMLLLSLSACAQRGNGDDTTTPPAADTTLGGSAESTEAPVTDGLPQDLSYPGESVVIVNRDFDYVKDEISVDEDDGDMLHSAISRRNSSMEERLGIKIVSEKITGNQYAVTDALKAAVSTSEHRYDIIANSCYSTIMYTAEGILRNLTDLEYLDLSQPYWSQGFNDAASIGNSQYMCTGAASLALYRLMFVTFFNRDLLETYKEKSLFDVVNDGQWTLDYQIRLGKDYYSDSDGNNAVNDGDTVGLITATLSYIDPYWSSCKNPILTKDSDNWYVYSVDVDRLATTLRKVTSLFYDANSYVIDSGGDTARHDAISKYFASDMALTATLRLCASEGEYLRNMTSKYGVIPMPKLDENQTDYYTFLHDQFTAFGICTPVDDARAEMLGAVLEYMAWSSSQIVVPVYYNVALKSKYMQDSASWDMLDKIYDGVYIDAGVIYTKSLNSVHQTPRNIVTSQIDSTASKFKSMARPVTDSLEKLQSNIRKLQEKQAG